MKKRHSILLMLTAACMISACSSDDETEPAQNPPLVIHVSETPMTNDGATAQAATQRGAIVNNTNFSEFYMRYGDEYTRSYTVTKSGSSWNASPPYSPGEGTHTFYAFSAGTFQWNEGNPYVNFAPDGNIPYQKDLLAAVDADVTGYEVNLSFRHVSSAVQFKICKTQEMADYTITVNEVALCNVVSVGDYYFTSGTWDLSLTKTSYTLNTSSIPLTTTPTDLDAASGTEYLFMIPQTLTAWDKTAISGSTTGSYLRLYCTITKGGSPVSGYSTNAYAYLPVGGTWKQDTKHTITLKVGTALRNASGTKITSL